MEWLPITCCSSRCSINFLDNDDDDDDDDDGDDDEDDDDDDDDDEDVLVWCRPAAEPAVSEKESKPEVKGEDAPDVAAQRSREKASEEQGQYPTLSFYWFFPQCCDILQATVPTADTIFYEQLGTCVQSELLSPYFCRIVLINI